MSATEDLRESFSNEISAFKGKLNIQSKGIFENRLFEDILSILHTKPIQALKERFQLGLVYKIQPYTEATHTRLEHTVGVVAKCLVAADLINENTADKTLLLTEKDVRELVVAAALHDCGHLPVSHATERSFLTQEGLTIGITHEERILPLIINRNPYFEELQNKVLQWETFDKNSFYRIASIISPKAGEDYKRTVPGFVMPKKAVQQLLVSDIDMDRLDYIIRDAQKLNYKAVTLIEDKLTNYLHGLSLTRYKSLIDTDYSESDAGEAEKNNVELSLRRTEVENVFYLLVSRVLLYKYVYFSKEVRSFEGVLTYLVGTLLEHNVSMQPLKLIAMSDHEFINNYLEELVGYIDEDDVREHLIEKYINVLRKEKIQRFRFVLSIHDYDIKNPRLKEEFVHHIKKRSYIDNLKNYLTGILKHGDSHGSGITMERSDVLLDVFNLKTGGGDLIVEEKERGAPIAKYRTLKDYMNGSNMHRLCSEIRLDIYCKSDMSETKRQIIQEKIESFFKTI